MRRERPVKEPLNIFLIALKSVANSVVSGVANGELGELYGAG